MRRGGLILCSTRVLCLTAVEQKAQGREMAWCHGTVEKNSRSLVADIPWQRWLIGSFVLRVVGFLPRFFFVRSSVQASSAINELRGAVDTLIVVANDRLLEVAGAGIPLERAFSVADDILRQVRVCVCV